MPTRRLRVVTGMQDVTLPINDKSTGVQLLRQVALELGVSAWEWLGLQYSDSKGRWWWLGDQKKVWSQRVNREEDPLTMYLKVQLYPPMPSRVPDTTLQRLVYLQVRAAVEAGELLCPPRSGAILTDLARQDRARQYLEVAEELKEYGMWNFLVMRPHDHCPIRLSVTTKGFVITVENRRIELPFSEVRDIEASGKKLVVRHTTKWLPETVFVCSEPAFALDLLHLARLHHDFYLRSGN